MPSEASEILARALEADAEAQESGQLNEIGMQYDEIENLILPINDIQPELYGTAMGFWDNWLDARNHEWRFHDPLMADDWPKLARLISASLRSNTFPEGTLFERYVASIAPTPKVPFSQWISRWFTPRA